MELYKYNFTYIFTIIYSRTIYYIDTISDGGTVIYYGTAKAVEKGTELIDPLSCIVEKTPTSLSIYVPEPKIDINHTFLRKDDIQHIQKQLTMMLQVAHKEQITDLVICIDGALCLEKVARVLQSTLYEKRGVFKTITICCPNTDVQNIYLDLFTIVNRF
jgi:hypothetical protein